VAAIVGKYKLLVTEEARLFKGIYRFRFGALDSEDKMFNLIPRGKK
jgi:hypothetical protein